ncbi:MAG: glycosyltransferase family 8 protein [Clostridia bacterium]
MNILIAVNKGYIKQLNVLLNSIQYANPKEYFDIYILSKDLEPKDDEVKVGLNLEKISLHIIKIPPSEIDKFPVYQKRYPVEIYFRLFATKYLPKNIKKVLYLDADTIVINELNELYETEFEGNYFIATTHIRKLLHKFNEIRLDIKEDEPYINTGVLLINLEELRKRNVEKEVIEYIENNKNKFMLPDQDIISGLYGNKIKLVDDLKYNLGDRALKIYNLNNPSKQITLKWICKNTVIIHYYGRNKPWNKDYNGKLGCFYKKIDKKIKR